MKKVKVLYVEDEPLIRDEIAFILEMEGYEVQTADDGQMGWDKFQTYCPDIVMTDLKMPRMNGVEMIEKIRNDLRSETPVIVISGFASKDWQDRVKPLNVQAYLTKPFSLKDIMSELNHATAVQWAIGRVIPKKNATIAC